MKKNEAWSMARKKWAIKFDNFINNIDVVQPDMRNQAYLDAEKEIAGIAGEEVCCLKRGKCRHTGRSQKKLLEKNTLLKEIDHIAWPSYIRDIFWDKRNYKIINLGTREIQIRMDTGEWSIGDEFFADQEEVINYLTREEQLKLLCCPIFHNL